MNLLVTRKIGVDMSMLAEKMNEDIQRIIDRLEHIKQEQNRWEKIRLVKQVTHSVEDYESYWQEKLADLAG
jgi:iron-sulfur cluster repair protein YtfE (RIC family)